MNSKPEWTKSFVSEHFSSERWRDFPWRDDDIVVATGAKSGTTWCLRIVGLLVHQTPERIDPHIMHAPWPDANFMGPIEKVHEEIAAMTHRRFFKSHLPLDAMPYNENAKYISVVRHPLDVFRSYLHHWGGMSDKVFEIFASVGYPDFPRLGEQGSIKEVWKRYITEGRMDWEQDGWPIHSVIGTAESFWQHRDRDNILLVHYANMYDDLEAEIRRIAAFLEIDATDDLIQEIVRLATFETMQPHIAKMNPHYDMIFSHGGDGFMIKGGVETWKGVLDTEDLQLYEARAAKLDPDFRNWLENGVL